MDITITLTPNQVTEVNQFLAGQIDPITKKPIYTDIADLLLTNLNQGLLTDIARQFPSVGIAAAEKAAKDAAVALQAAIDAEKPPSVL